MEKNIGKEKKSSTASDEEVYNSFHYSEGLENRLTRAPL